MGMRHLADPQSQPGPLPPPHLTPPCPLCPGTAPPPVHLQFGPIEGPPPQRRESGAVV